MKYASLTNETQLQVSFQFHQVSSCLNKSELSIPKEFGVNSNLHETTSLTDLVFAFYFWDLLHSARQNKK